MINKYLKLLLLLLLLPFISVKADVCDEADITRIKEMSKNITANYQYLGDINADGNYQLYEVNFNFAGLDGDVYIKYLYDDKKLYNSSDKLYVDSGKRDFIIYSSKCADAKVGYITVNLPKFNIYSLTDGCLSSEGNLEICDKWYQGNLSLSKYNEIIDEYYDNLDKEFNDNKLLDFILENYLYIILFFSISILMVIFLIVRKRKRSILD